MSFRIDVISLFPELFPGPLAASNHGRALADGIWLLAAHQLREFAADRHRTVDDTPAGGGPGMVLRPDVVAQAVDSVSPHDDNRPRLVMSARGRPLDQECVRDLARAPGLVIICGRFEGFDERVIEARNLIEVSIGDFVLSGGEVAAMALIEAVVRLLPGVTGSAESLAEESHEAGLLEYPHYTRPQVFEGHEIPAVLTSGDHAKIEQWRRQTAEALTRERRPDLWAKRSK